MDAPLASRERFPYVLSSRTAAALPRYLIGDAHAAKRATIPVGLGQLEHLFLENERAYGPCRLTSAGRRLTCIGRIQ
jgi:hypothetical protein